MRKENRGASNIRKIKIQPYFMKYAEGSCLFDIGNTRVICTASIEDGVPSFLKGQGTGWITSEYGMIPRSCQKRVQRESSTMKKNGRTQEIQRLIGRALRSTVDLKALGEKTIWIDCDVIQADGGTRCASITGSFIALCLALASLKKDKVFEEIPIRHYLAAISAGIVDGKVYLDLDYDEDSRAEVDMNVVMTDSGDFVEVQGTAERGVFSSEEMGMILTAAKKGINKLIDEQKKILKGI